MPSAALSVLLVILVLVLVVALLRRTYGAPPGNAALPSRQRMPKAVQLAGWLLLGLGLLVAVMGFNSAGRYDATALRISAVLLALAGLGFLLLYRNWYIEPDRDEIRYRTGLGETKTIVYSDIVHYASRERRGQTYLDILTTDGSKLKVSMTKYNLTPTIAAIEFQQVNGRWPTPGEPR